MLVKACWICGEVADSREHIIKKTDVESVFGSGSYQGRLIRQRTVGQKGYSLIQGPNSSNLKYLQNICRHCNGAKTQPFDNAYEELINYLIDNYNRVRDDGQLNFKLIYGKDRKKVFQQKMFKYLIKAFGCRLDSSNIRVPDELIAAINGLNYGTSMSVSLQLCFKKIEAAGSGHLLKARYSHEPFDRYLWWFHTGPFFFNFAYNTEMPVEYGNGFYAKKKYWPISILQEDQKD